MATTGAETPHVGYFFRRFFPFSDIARARIFRARRRCASPGRCSALGGRRCLMNWQIRWRH